MPEDEEDPDKPKWVHGKMTPAPGPSGEPVRRAVNRANIEPPPTPALDSAVKRLVREITAKLKPR